MPSFPPDTDPLIIPRPDHCVSRSNIESCVQKVLYRLHRSGHLAYLVGGGVRDLLLGRTPKDYDVATDAKPSEVRRLFRNSRIIGRRFRLVHVLFADRVVEVSTFRTTPHPGSHGDTDEDLFVTSDNVYGSPAEDAFRRDFTVNALFYNIADFSVIDYVGGLADLEAKTIRVIGDPPVRFQEDPVRMLRACEFAGRLGFGMGRKTQEAIQELKALILKSSSVRLCEEVFQLLRCGRAGAAVQWMLDLGLLEPLLPEAYAMMGSDSGGEPEYGGLLPALDRLTNEGEPVSDGVLLGTLLLPKILRRREHIEALDSRAMSRAALRGLVEDSILPFAERFTLSRRRKQETSQTVYAFFRLCEPRWRPQSRAQFARKPYFGDALQLFQLMVEATGGEGREKLIRWQAAGQRRRQPQEPRVSTARRRRRRRPRTE